MQTARRRKAALVRELRTKGATWKDVEAKASVKPDLGRTLLKELEAFEASQPEPKIDKVAEAKEKLAEPAPTKTPRPKDPAPRRSGRYIKAVCKCEKINVIRTSPTALERGITCGGCGKAFKVAS